MFHVLQAPASSWRPALPLASGRLHGWLTDTGSLTTRIVARCGKFRVQVLSQALQVPHRDEAAVLGLRAGERAWVREVLLLADGVPCVYARSIVSRSDLRSAWPMFAGVGSRSLGAVLFADPRVRRGALVARRIDARDARYHRVQSVHASVLPVALWARRSAFMRHGAPLIVCEIFLPGIQALQT